MIGINAPQQGPAVVASFRVRTVAPTAPTWGTTVPAAGWSLPV